MKYAGPLRKIPVTYDEAVYSFRADLFDCSREEWESRTPEQNTQWLCNYFYALAAATNPEPPDDSQPDCTPHLLPDGKVEFRLFHYPGLDSFNFNGVEFRIGFAVDNLIGQGYCDDVKKLAEHDPSEKPLLWISDELIGPSLCRVAIHEALHACLPGLSEGEVDRISCDITAFAMRVLMFKDAVAKGKSIQEAVAEANKSG